MALVARALTDEEEDDLLGVEEPVPPRTRGGLIGLKNGDEFLAALREWIRTHHVDNWDSAGQTLLLYAAYARDPFRENNGPAPEYWVQLARDLIARGANPSISKNWNGTTPLMWACKGPAPLEMVPLLLDAGADVRAKARRGYEGKTALAFLFQAKKLSTGDTLTIVHMLLRAGATLDACCSQLSAEDLLDACCNQEPAKGLLRRVSPRWPAYATDPHLTELKRVFRGVRAAKGSYARYAKKEIMVLLALVRKDRASTKWFYAGDHRTAFDILAKSPNEIVWHVLAFSFGISVGSAGAGGYYDSRPRTPTLNVEDFDNDALSIEDEGEFDFDEGEFVIE